MKPVMAGALYRTRYFSHGTAEVGWGRGHGKTVSHLVPHRGGRRTPYGKYGTAVSPLPNRP
jgi:hypothetical protein